MGSFHSWLTVLFRQTDAPLAGALLELCSLNVVLEIAEHGLQCLAALHLLRLERPELLGERPRQIDLSPLQGADLHVVRSLRRFANGRRVRCKALLGCGGRLV